MALQERLLAGVRAAPGSTTSVLARGLSARRSGVAAVLSALERAGAVRSTRGPRGARLWWPAQSGAADQAWTTPESHRAERAFCLALAAELDRQLPGDFEGELHVQAQAGCVVRPVRVTRADHLRREGGWPGPAFSGDLAGWIGRRVPAGWWGTVSVVIQGGRVAIVKLASAHRVGC